MSRTNIQEDASSNPVGFADRLRSLQAGSGYSTRQLGALAGVSHGTIANWTTGKGRASLDEVTWEVALQKAIKERAESPKD